MSNLISQKAFADLCGVSAPAISKAIRNERLNKVGTKIDLDCELSKQFLKIQKEKKPKSQKKPANKKTAKKKENIEDEDKPQMSLSLELTDAQLLLFPKLDIDKLDKIEAAKTKKFNRQVARGKYIHRDMIKSVFAKLYSVDTNELKEMEDRLTPGICGVFKKNDDSPEAVQVRQLLNEEITKSLRHIQRIMDDFLKSQKV